MWWFIRLSDDICLHLTVVINQEVYKEIGLDWTLSITAILRNDYLVNLRRLTTMDPIQVAGSDRYVWPFELIFMSSSFPCIRLFCIFPNTKHRKQKCFMEKTTSRSSDKCITKNFLNWKKKRINVSLPKTFWNPLIYVVLCYAMPMNFF